MKDQVLVEFDQSIILLWINVGLDNIIMENRLLLGLDLAYDKEKEKE